jgi:hypothetical protein
VRGFPLNPIAIPQEARLNQSLHTPQEIPPVNEPIMPPPTLPEDEPVPVEDPPANPVPTDKPLRM